MHPLLQDELIWFLTVIGGTTSIICIAGIWFWFQDMILVKYERWKHRRLVNAKRRMLARATPSFRR